MGDYETVSWLLSRVVRRQRRERDLLAAVSTRSWHAGGQAAERCSPKAKARRPGARLSSASAVTKTRV